MTLEASFIELDEKLAVLEQALNNLLWAVVQGQPEAEPGHALVDHYEGPTNDLLGYVKGARKAVRAGLEAIGNQRELSEMRQALIQCHTCLNQLSCRLYHDLVAIDWLDALNEFADERQDEWAKWVVGVKDALNRCPQPLDDFGQALLQSWQDLTERLDVLSVSVHTTSIGQEFYIARQKEHE